MIPYWNEFKSLQSVLSRPPRSKSQVNGLFEADCEILRVGKNFFGFSIDCISEEIALGLYRNPETWGWLAVATSVSDLCASALKPTGLMLACQWAFDSRTYEKKKFFASAFSALRKTRVPFLGGDTGQASHPSFTSSITGCSKDLPLTRLGVRSGDWVVMVNSHDFGIGPMLGIRWLLDRQPKLQNLLEKNFRPHPDWRLNYKVRPLINASIDTSDGLATSLGVISALNKVGFEINLKSLEMAPIAQRAIKSLKLPTVAPLLGDHGDFHTLLFVSDKNIKSLLKTDARLKVIGQATSEKKGIQVVKDQARVPLLYKELMSCPRDLTSLRHLLGDLVKFYEKSGF